MDRKLTQNIITAGEELFLSHLANTTVDDEIESLDRNVANGNDLPPSIERKDRSISIGEELWIVHCKRAQGADIETDKDPLLVKKSKISASSPSKGVVTRAYDRVLGLRNRDIQIH